MKKKMSIVWALLLSLVLFVAACAPSTPVETEPVSTEPAGTEPVPAGKTKVSFAVQADSTPALDALIDAFNAQSDKYEAEATIMTNDSGQMQIGRAHV